jgi:hypothetical protein
MYGRRETALKWYIALCDAPSNSFHKSRVY